MRTIMAVLVASLLSACSFMVKTPNMSDYSRLSHIGKDTSRTDVAILLGSPQGKGVHVLSGETNAMEFFYGFAGKFTLSTAQYDSGTAFISYENDRPRTLLYFTSKATGPEITLGKPLSIGALVGRVVLGETSFVDAKALIGPPDYIGRRIDFKKGIDNEIGFWDASKIETKGSINEKWLLIGYDSRGIVQDLAWVSSRPEDIAELGSISEQHLKQLSRWTIAGFLPVLEPTALRAGTSIDAGQVDALIAKAPHNVKDISAIIGLPTAHGIKSYFGEPPLLLSNWSFSTLELKP